MNSVDPCRNEPLSATSTCSRGLGASLLFPDSAFPDAEALACLFEGGESPGIPARVCHRSADGNCLEVLVSGLTVEVRRHGAKGDVPLCDPGQHYGFAKAPLSDRFGIIEIAPGRHIAAGARLLPIVETVASLAANIALNLPAAAVDWHTAGTRVEPRFFSQSVLNWLAGGPFPALGLTALVPGPESSVSSRGLQAITGQEMRLAGAPEESPDEAMRTAARVVDYLVRHGRLTVPREITGRGLSLVAEPSQFGDVVWVWRK
jgi:hypothetical protein